MEVLKSTEGSPHHSNMVPDCSGNEDKFISCFTPRTINTVCDYLLVECRSTHNSVTTPPQPSSPPSTSYGSSGGVTNTVFAGVVIALVVVIAVVGVLITVVLKKKRDSDTHESR